MSKIWVVMLSVGFLTFLTRLSFIYLFEKWDPPEIITSGLRFVPIAVLTAIFIPEITLSEGNLSLSFGNFRLIAGMIAIVIAWRTKNALWTICAGMFSFWLLTWIL